MSPAVKIPLVYLFAGFLWILFSDLLLAVWIDDADTMRIAQTYKGWFFILVTAFLLFLLIKRSFKRLEKTRNNLNQTLKHYSYLFHHNPQPMWVYDFESLDILDANRAAQKDYGYHSGEFLTMSMLDLIPAEDIPSFKESLREEGLEYQRISGIRHQKSDGSIIEVEMISHILPEYQGRKCRMVIANDITTRKKAFESLKKNERALKESERQLQTLLSNLPGMAYRCKNDLFWTMLFVSKGCEQVVGYKAEELENSSIISYGKIIHPQDRKRVWREVQNKVSTQRKYPIVYRIITSKGEVRWVWEQAQGVFDEEGKLLFIEGFITDITHQRKTEKALKHYGDFLRTIIDNIPFPMYYKDIQGKYMGCNKEFYRYLGKTKEEVIGKTVDDLLIPSQAAQSKAKDRELLKTKEHQKYETRITFPDGKSMEVVLHKSVFLNEEGEPGGIIGVYFDISDRVMAENIIKKQVEELERINAELERFTYTVSHDLRSPLVTIKGFLGMLREDLEAGNFEQMEMDMQRISNATDKMHHLLEDLLQLSRIGRVGNPFTSFSMNGVVGEVLEYLDGIIRENQCSIEVQTNLPVVFADRSRIMEVLQNLIENAVKFKADHQIKPHITIGCRRELDPPVFYVQDNGIGIAPLYQKKIFGLFNKLDQASRGTGIGLALVQRIIEFHGGRVWVESEGTGKGSRFCFTLPGSFESLLI